MIFLLKILTIYIENDIVKTFHKKLEKSFGK